MINSLKDKTAKGVMWSGIDNVTGFAVSFFVGIILARLLSPDDYGLLGLIGIFPAICTTLTFGGFYSALVRKKDASEDDYNTVFVVNMATSIVFYAILFLGAPLIADFFDRQELVSLVRVSSIGMVVGAFSMVQQVRLTKRIDFKSQTKVTFVGSVISGIIGVLMALTGFGVWSLVAQSLSNQFIRTTLLCYYNSWLPSLVFSLKSFRELFGFGSKLLVSGLLNTIWNEMSQVVIGKFYSSASLGQYSRAKGFSLLFSDNLTNVIQRVTFPVLSNIQDEPDRMFSSYRRIIKVTMFITAICMFALGAVSEPLIYCLIGEKWHDAATYLPLICISSSLFPLQALNLNILQVKGRSDLFLVLEVVKKIILLAPLFIGAFIGILPMLYANILASVLCYYVNSYYSGRLIGYSLWMQVKDILPSYCLAIAIALSIYFLKYLPFSCFIILPMQIVLGVLVFSVLNLLMKPEEYMEIRSMILPYLRNNKR